MTLTSIIVANLVLSVLTMAAVAALVRLAHRLPQTVVHDDEAWGADRRIASDPLPVLQIARHESERELARAA